MSSLADHNRQRTLSVFSSWYLFNKVIFFLGKTITLPTKTIMFIDIYNGHVKHERLLLVIFKILGVKKKCKIEKDNF